MNYYFGHIIWVEGAKKYLAIMIILFFRLFYHMDFKIIWIDMIL